MLLYNQHINTHTHNQGNKASLVTKVICLLNTLLGPQNALLQNLLFVLPYTILNHHNITLHYCSYFVSICVYFLSYGLFHALFNVRFIEEYFLYNKTPFLRYSSINFDKHIQSCNHNHITFHHPQKLPAL